MVRNSVPKSETKIGQVGCPWTAHCWVSGLLKSVPGLCENGHKGPCVLVLKLCELNGLVCVGINLESWLIKELLG